MEVLAFSNETMIQSVHCVSIIISFSNKTMIQSVHCVSCIISPYVLLLKFWAQNVSSHPQFMTLRLPEMILDQAHVTHMSIENDMNNVTNKSRCVCVYMYSRLLGILNPCLQTLPQESKYQSSRQLGLHVWHIGLDLFAFSVFP